MRIKAGKTEFECGVASTPGQKARGLMLKRKIKPLLFELNRESIHGSTMHMLFMLKPIDMVFLNSQKIVVDVQNARPWTFMIRPRKPAKYVLEIPEGMGKKFKPGDKVEFKPN